jgi:hypothetical protein
LTQKALFSITHHRTLPRDCGYFQVRDPDQSISPMNYTASGGGVERHAGIKFKAR